MIHMVRNLLHTHFAAVQLKPPIAARFLPTFAPAPTTWIVGLAWIEEHTRFSDECLLMPTEDLIGIAGDGGDRWVVNFDPVKPERTPVDPYRRRLANLGEFIGQITSIG
jgi:hypothetical protein